MALARLRAKYLIALNHDLRNPIAAQLNLAESLLEGIPGPLNERQRVYVQRIEEKARLLLVLLGDVMELAGRDSHPQLAAPDPALVRVACDCVTRLTSAVAAKKGKTSHLEYFADRSSPAPPTTDLIPILLSTCSEVIRCSEPGGEFTLRVETGSDGWYFRATDPSFRAAKGAPKNSDSPSKIPSSNCPAVDLSLAHTLLAPAGGRLKQLSVVSQAIGFEVFLPTSSSK